jgi:hypothetical protein
MKVSVLVAVASLVALSPAAWGQSAGTVGTKASSGGSSTVGTAGSAAAGGTSASTVGLGAHSTGTKGNSSSIASGGSAAADHGRVRSGTRVHENRQMLQARSRATAQDGGTWSKSATNTRVMHNGDLSSRTRSMAHEPGGKPAMSKTRMK